jgi:hypothetical protein
MALAIAMLVVVAACTDQSLTSPEGDNVAFTPLSGTPIARANANCHYTPDGEFVHIPTGNVQTFFPNSTSDCAGAYIEIIYGAGQAGAAGFFPNATNDCALKTWTATTGWIFKVRKCTSGPSRANIYNSSSKTTLIQTIGIDLL